MAADSTAKGVGTSKGGDAGLYASGGLLVCCDRRATALCLSLGFRPCVPITDGTIGLGVWALGWKINRSTWNSSRPP